MLLGKLLDYVAKGGFGTFREMSAATGIPMGVSNGKMPAIYSYALGMGLIVSNDSGGVKAPRLTPFGRMVCKEDEYLGQSITQWIAHINLCRKDIGAKTWNLTFAAGSKIIGNSFTKNQLEEYLATKCGGGKDRVGPLLSTYLEDAALARAGVILNQRDAYQRKKAPLVSSFASGYSYILLMLLETFFPQQGQVTITDFEDSTSFFGICLWDEADRDHIFTFIERKGFLTVDRQMKPWLLERRASSEEALKHLYDDIA